MLDDQMLEVQYKGHIIRRYRLGWAVLDDARASFDDRLYYGSYQACIRIINQVTDEVS